MAQETALLSGGVVLYVLLSGGAERISTRCFRAVTKIFISTRAFRRLVWRRYAQSSGTILEWSLESLALVR